MLLYGSTLVIGTLAGGRDPLQPLAPFGGTRAAAAAVGNAGEAHATPFERVRTLAELDARIKTAAKPVLLDFYADWCVSCKEMERFTFADPAVAKRLGDFVLLQADVTANSADDAALLKRFNLFGPPGIIFFDRDGREISGLRVVGFQNAATFGKTLDTAGSRAGKRV
jgi:thiol:disulfide interchange protein DsbD